MSTTVLAVDDSKTMRRVLEITFASEDFKTLLATNADEALELVGAEAPSVALIDASLGAASGYDLCQRIKAQAPGTAVLVLSSKQQPYDRGRGSAAGADDFMDKPFDTQQLIDKVKALTKNATAGAPYAAAVPASAHMPARVQPTAESPRAQTLSYGTPAPPPGRPMPASRPMPARAHATAPGMAPAPQQAAPQQAAPQQAAAASQLAHAAVSNGQLAGKLENLGLSQAQIEAVLALSREVVERVVWEVVPTLAEMLIKEELQRLTSE